MTTTLYFIPSADYATNATLLAALNEIAEQYSKASPSTPVTVVADRNTSALIKDGAVVFEVSLVGGESTTATASSSSADPSLYTLRAVVDISSDESIESSIGRIIENFDTLRNKTDYTFVSTRHDSLASNNNSTAASSFGFLEAVKEGLCKDGGLFMPRSLPSLAKEELAYLCGGGDDKSSGSSKNKYHRTAQFVIEKLVGLPAPASSFSSADNKESRYGALPIPSPATISACITKGYDPSRWNNLTSSVSPLTDLMCGQQTAADKVEKHLAAQFPNLTSSSSTSSPAITVLEQYHGPTAAFKDFALQLFPTFFAVSTATDANRYMILAATSGDTGVAAINGFMQNGAEDTKVMVLFPEDGVSPVQKAQMLSYNDGKRVQVVGLGADFDYCQSTIKRVFNDKAVAEALLSPNGTAAKPTVLSSANSINWGRLLPQIVYYIHAYTDLVAAKKLAHPLDSSSSLPTAFDVVVPCGNFGNILSCYVAKKMGLPVRRFIVASNENDVLADFINTGVYDITQRKLSVTSSPSIDILRASNVERFLYFIYDGNTDKVRSLMQQLDTDKKFVVDADVFNAKIKGTFWASKCDEGRCRDVIKAVFQASNGHRLFDPHTGVGIAVVEDFIEDCKKKGEATTTPIVLTSTAHWGKFPEPVMASLGIALTEEESSASKNNVVTLVQNMHNCIEKHCPNAQAVPTSLRTAVSAPHHVTPMVMPSPSYEAIVKEVLVFAAAPCS